MGVEYGRQTLGNTGRQIAVAAESNPDWKPGGITIDWSTVAAVGSDTTLLDDLVVKNGYKYLRYGQILTRISVAEVQTLTHTGGPTAGTATITLPAVGNDPAQTFTVAFNATAAEVQASMVALSRFGANGVSVGRTGAGSNGDPYIYTLTFNRNLGNVPTLTQTNTFTGGTTPTETIATSTAGNANNGMYGPYDSAASDGRQTLTRGDCYILNESVLESGVIPGLQTQATNHPAVIEGGLVWKDRILMTTGTHSLAVGPTVTEFLAAFPRIRFAQN